MMFDAAYAPQLFALLGLVLILAELLLGLDTGFDLVVVGSILLISGLLGGLIGGLPLTLILACVLAISYFFMFRKVLRAKLRGQGEALNTDRLIGASGKLIKAVSKNKPGLVEIDGEEWRCTSKTPITKGTEVIVTEISGVTVSVTPRKP